MKPSRYHDPKLGVCLEGGDGGIGLWDLWLYLCLQFLWLWLVESPWPVWHGRIVGVAGRRGLCRGSGCSSPWTRGVEVASCVWLGMAQVVS